LLNFLNIGSSNQNVSVTPSFLAPEPKAPGFFESWLGEKDADEVEDWVWDDEEHDDKWLVPEDEEGDSQPPAVVKRLVYRSNSGMIRRISQKVSNEPVVERKLTGLSRKSSARPSINSGLSREVTRNNSSYGDVSRKSSLDTSNVLSPLEHIQSLDEESD
jgi:hypothetical protein